MTAAERMAIFERDRARAERDKARFERDRERAERDKVKAPIEAKMQEKQLEREREKERSNNKIGLTAIGLLVALSFICLLALNAPNIGASFAGNIAVPASSEDLAGISYLDAEQRFTDAGFTNIECIGLNDLNLVSELFNGTGSVDHITINGEVSFDSSSLYPPDATIRIYYHSHPD